VVLALLGVVVRVAGVVDGDALATATGGLLLVSGVRDGLSRRALNSSLS
jgi:hypothetical protein